MLLSLEEILKSDFEVYELIRSSSLPQKLSIEFQHEANKRKAAELGIKIPEENVFTDYGVSGFTVPMQERKNTMRMIDKILKSDKPGIVIAFRRDRLTRRAREYMYMVHLFLRYKTWLVFSDPSEFPFTISNGYIIECVFAGLLQKQCEDIRSKVALGLQTKHNKGLWIGGRPGFGFKYNKTTKKIEAVENEVNTGIDIILDLSQGKRPDEIVNHLKENKIICPGNKHWSEKLIHKIGSNLLYLGTALRFDKEVKLKDIGEYIDHVTFEKAQETLANNPLPHVVKKERKEINSLLDNLVYCTNSNHSYKVIREKDKIYYQCPVRRKNCKADCKNNKLEKEYLENLVIDYLKLSFSSINTSVLEQWAKNVIKHKISKILKDINVLKTKRDRYYKEKIIKSDQYLMETNIANKEVISKKFIALNQQEMRLKDMLAEKELALASLNKISESHREIMNLIKDWDLFKNLDYSQQKAICSQLIMCVIVEPAHVKVNLKTDEIFGLAG